MYLKDACTSMITTVVFTIARKCQQIPPADEWIMKLWTYTQWNCIQLLGKNEIMVLAREWVELEIIM